MNTLDDLRLALDAHADGLDGLDPTTRGEQVRGRIRTSRRRRVAGGTAAAAAAVLVVSGLATLPWARTPDPASTVPDRLAGHDVPATITAAGWTYEYADSVSGSGAVEMSLDQSDEPRLVTWAADGESTAWQVVVPGEPDLVSTRADFGDWWLLSPGTPAPRVGFDGAGGQTALAVYELSDRPPAGVTSDGVTFREDVAGDRLVTADTARGASTLSMPVSVPEGTMRLGSFCAGAPAGAQLEVTVDGRTVGTGPCDDEVYFDPGAFWSISWPDGLETGSGVPAAGDLVEVELVLTGPDGEPVDASRSDVLLGASIYQVAPTGTEITGQPVPELVEAYGHTWALDGTVESDPGDRTMLRRFGSGPPLLVQTYFSDLRDGRVYTTVDGRRTGAQMSGAGSGSGGPLLVPPGGSQVGVHVQGDLPPDTRLGLASYARAD